MSEMQINNLSTSQVDSSHESRGESSGMRSAIVAMAAFLPAILQFANMLMALSTTISDLQSEMTKGWAAITKEDQEKLQALAKSTEDPKTKNPKISLATAEYNEHTLLANMSQQSWSALNDQINLGTSTITNDASVYTSVQTKGSVQIGFELTRILKNR